MTEGQAGRVPSGLHHQQILAAVPQALPGGRKLLPPGLAHGYVCPNDDRVSTWIQGHCGAIGADVRLVYLQGRRP